MQGFEFGFCGTRKKAFERSGARAVKPSRLASNRYLPLPAYWHARRFIRCVAVVKCAWPYALRARRRGVGVRASVGVVNGSKKTEENNQRR